MNDLAPVFARQAQACAALGSPFTARMLPIAAAQLRPGNPVADRLLGWPGDISHHGANLPLRLAGALHALALTEADAGISHLWPPGPGGSDAELAEAIAAALDTHAPTILAWLDNAPQTNEVRRAAALIAVARQLAARWNLPLRVSELGASAGLNLFFDAYALQLPGGTTLGPDRAVLTLAPEMRGALPPEGADPVIAERRGADLNPLAPDRPSDVLRLRAYTWPDQRDRMERLDAALTVARPLVDRADAAPWLQARLADPQPGVADFVYHTIAWQYFPAETQEACRATLEARGAAATDDTPLAWLAVESDGDEAGAAVTLRLWPGDHHLQLGRMDFHGRWLDLAAGITI